MRHSSLATPCGPRPAVRPIVGVPRGLGDLSWTFPTQYGIYDEVMRSLPGDDPVVQAIPRRHGGRWNVGFCDAHVENLSARKLFGVRNPTVGRRWNNDHKPHKEVLWYLPY